MNNKRNKIKNRILYLVIGMFLFGLCFHTDRLLVSASDTSEWKTVKVSCGINKSLYYDEDGNIAGYCSEYLDDLAQINHWNIEYVEGSWNESVQNLQDGKIDILFPTQMTEERKRTMGFSTAIGGYQPIGLYAPKDSTLCYDDYEGFEGKKIAVSAGTSNEEALKEYAENNQFEYETVYIDAAEEKEQALSDGKVDMIVFSTLNDVEDGKVVAMLGYLPFYYCTRADDTELLEELNYGMNQMIIRHADVVQNVFYSFMNKNISFAYTTEEQEEIKEKGNIIVGIYKDTEPLFGVTSNGEYQGIYVDMIQRIEEISGLHIEIRALDRKKLAFEYLDAGEVDFVMGSSDQTLKDAGKSHYLQSEGIMDYYTVKVTKTDFKDIAADDLTYALTSGRRYWEQEILKESSNATFIYYDTSKQCLDAVQSNKADITLLNTWEYNYQSKNQRFSDLMEWENTRQLSQSVFISMESENEQIRSVLNKSIEQISNAEKEGMISANLSGTYNSYSFIDRLYVVKEFILIFGAILLILAVAFSMYFYMRRKSVEELKESNEKLVAANASKDIFLSRMSHELRTPLNAIGGYATVLQENLESREYDEGKIKTFLDSILRATKYQLAIISDLLDFQKIESGKLELLPGEVDSKSYMENIVEMVQPEADEKQIEFTYERINTVNDTYYLDGVRLQQVLLNILHNAIKFTPNGGKVKLTSQVIDHDEISNTLKFVISDTGIGMSEDFQNNYLFHRFAQEYQGNTSPYEGCGTGLAISKDIVHMMGGEITCKSEVGVGSTFTVIIVAKHIEKKRRRTRTLQMHYDLQGMRVLLCEDNQMNQDIEKRLLEKMNCKVDIAEDGQIGFGKVRDSEEGYYDIILMDIRMPNMDGLEATRAIRGLEREDVKHIPIMAVSANAFEEDVQKSLDAGMNEHLAKPVDVKILYEKMNKYVSKRSV